ncbi:longifolia 1/2 [Tanacetum coccineum]
MSTKEVVHTLIDDQQELQKQLGCMNGLFQLFDRRYLLGQRRRSHTQKRLPPPPGKSDNGEKESKIASEQAKETSQKVVTKEKNRVSVELPRNSISSSTSSTALSSLDCSKRAQTDISSSCQSVISELSSSSYLHRKQPDLFMQSPDIRDVVKDSMTREPRAVPIKTAARDERVGPAMKYVDSPRPFPHQQPVQYEGIHDRNLAKLREMQWGVERVKEPSRFSCDGRESRYLSKSSIKVKELPRLSLDSKRPSSSSVVARLMGLEALTAPIDKSETLKTKEEELKHERASVSPRVRKNPVSPQRGTSHVITRIPLETAPWKQEGGSRGSQRPPFKGKDGPVRVKPVSTSIYGEIEKRLTEHEYKTSGKDLRALKQILEAMQKTKMRLENTEHPLDDDRQSQKSDQLLSPSVKGTSPLRKHESLKVETKPAMMVTGLRKVKQTDAKKDSAGRQRLKDPTIRDRKATGRPLSPSNFQEYTGTVSTRLQRSKNGTSSDLSKTKKQRNHISSTTRNPKTKSMDRLQESSETVSFQSESYSLASQNDSEVTSAEWMQEVNSPFRQKENHRGNIAERLIEDTPIADHAKHTMEQPSPVSVLDAFYTEESPSPVKKKLNTLYDDENIHFEEAQANNTHVDQYSEFNIVKLENIKSLVHQIELLNTSTDDDATTVNDTASSSSDGETGDHRYVAEILGASGCLKDLDRTATIVQLNPTGGLINPELFHVLEKTKGCIEFTDGGYHKKNMRARVDEKIRRKLVFDTVSDVLGYQLATMHKGRILTGDKLLKELCLGIDSLQNNSERGLYDEEDEVINIINADVNKRSHDWDEYCYQVPGLVLDIERMIFKDLISEVVNAQVKCLKDWPVKHRRQLFSM